MHIIDKRALESALIQSYEAGVYMPVGLNHLVRIIEVDHVVTATLVDRKNLATVSRIDVAHVCLTLDLLTRIADTMADGFNEQAA